MESLGHVIFRNGIGMDLCKVQIIVNWATQDVQCFLGFANFYQCFIAHYSSTQLTRKDQFFSYGVEINNVFQSLKIFSTTTPLLIHANSS